MIYYLLNRIEKYPFSLRQTENRDLNMCPGHPDNPLEKPGVPNYQLEFVSEVPYKCLGEAGKYHFLA